MCVIFNKIKQIKQIEKFESVEDAISELQRIYKKPNTHAVSYLKRYCEEMASFDKTRSYRDKMYAAFDNITSLELLINNELDKEFGDNFEEVILDYDLYNERLIVNIYGNLPYPLEPSLDFRELMKSHGFKSYNIKYVFKETGDYIIHGNPRFNDDLPKSYHFKYGNVNTRFDEKAYKKEYRK